MKKLITIITCAFSLCVANAASVDWKVTGTSAQKGYSVYVLTSLASEYASADEIATAAISNGTIAKSGMTYTTGTKYITNDAVTKDSMKNAYLVLIKDATDTEYTYMAVDLSSSVYDTQAQETTPGAFSTSVNNLVSGGTTASFSSVPEPTSGLLLLLGMAGLALRRKQK